MFYLHFKISNQLNYALTGVYHHVKKGEREREREVENQQAVSLTTKLFLNVFSTIAKIQVGRREKE